MTTTARVRPSQTTLDVPSAALPAPDAKADYEYLRSRDAPTLPADDPNPIGFVDLFCGCGGLSLGVLEGARRAGRAAELLLAIDADPFPLSVLQETLGGDPDKYASVDLGSILSKRRSEAAPVRALMTAFRSKVSLLVAGPPCQGHSALNNHTRHDDPRNDLYVAVARAAELLDPSAVVVENVGGVARDRRSGVARCSAKLEELGYVVTAQRLDLHGLGVPQRRVRHVLVATKNQEFEWDLEALPARSVAWAISDLLDIESGSVLDTASKPSPENAARIKWLFDHDKTDLPNRLRPICHQADHSYVSMYGRLSWDQPAQTITSGYGSMGQGRFVHPLRPRTLTPHEAARLQFLPDFVRFPSSGRTALANMIGNVAPPRLTIAIVGALIAQGML